LEKEEGEEKVRKGKRRKRMRRRKRRNNKELGTEGNTSKSDTCVAPSDIDSVSPILSPSSLPFVFLLHSIFIKATICITIDILFQESIHKYFEWM
jgi:hypothetical protein